MSVTTVIQPDGEYFVPRPPLKERTCATCRHFHDTQEDMHECYRYPPKAFWTGDRFSKRVYPEVCIITRACGEYEHEEAK